MLSLRLAALSLLLVAEILYLTLRFDLEPLASQTTWCVQVLLHARLLIQASIAIGAVLLLFASSELRIAGETLAKLAAQHPNWLAYILVHLLAFSWFTILTAHIVQTTVLQSSSWAAGWVVGWFLLGFFVLLSWLAAIIPIGNCWQLVRDKLGMFLAAGLVAIAAIVSGQLAMHLWNPLGAPTLWLVHHALAFWIRDVVCLPDQFIVGTSSFTVEIAPDCSGYDGIGLIWVFLAVYLWSFRHALLFPRALLIPLVGTVLIWLVNIVRIVSLIALGNWVSPTLAQGGFHSQAGWIGFNLVALGLVLTTQRTQYFAAQRQPKEADKATRNADLPYLAPLLSILATSMIGEALCESSAWLYEIQIAPGALALVYYGRHYVRLGCSWTWQAPVVGFVAFLLWLPFYPQALASAQDASSSLASQLAGLSDVAKIAWVVCRIAGSVLVIPLAEELVFRAYLPRRLQTSSFESVPIGQFTWLSFLILTTLFGLLHQHWMAAIVAGSLYALVLWRTRNFLDAVIAHATTNALIAVYVLSTGNAILWAR